MCIFDRVKMMVIEHTLYKVNRVFQINDLDNRDEELYNAISEAVLLAFDIGKNDSRDNVKGIV